MSAIGLGFTPSTGQSIFPDIYAVINSPNSNELHAALKQALSGAVKQQALPTSQWTKKNILGVDTEYMVSMLGVGVYLAPSEDKLILGSSESAITTAIKTAKGEKSSLSSSLSAKAQNLALKDNGLVAGHMNFPELALTLKSLHGSMAMFSGGETPSLKELEEITKYGSITFNVTTNGNIIELASRVDLPPESPK
ncbi:MAG: hypothetical protein R3A13_11185 [Bdellovibrionota bacterium]